MKLLDQVHEACLTKHYSPRTEESYVRWIERFLRFHRDAAGKWIHPLDMTAEHVESFLTHLAVRRHVSASTQNQALNALVFLFRDVAKKEIGPFDAVRAKRPSNSRFYATRYLTKRLPNAAIVRIGGIPGATGRTLPSHTKRLATRVCRFSSTILPIAAVPPG